MADKYLSREPFDGMGIKDFVNLTLKDWTSSELKRLERLVIEEPLVSSGTKTINDILIENKKAYYERIHINIMETKTAFLNMFNQINDCIEEMTREIIIRAQNRREELQGQLQKLRKCKIDKWNRQLSICEGVLQQLNCHNSSCSFCDGFSTNHVFEDFINSELKWVESGEINLDAQDFQKILKTIETLGTIKPGSKCVAPKFIFGSAGSNEGQFCRPWGVCSDDTGRILVCDRCNHRVQIFNESGQFIIQFGKEGSQPGEFNRPTGIAVDKKCRVIVADKDNHRIQVFTYSGHFLFSFGRYGTKPGEFMYPWDVAVNENCEIAVSDSKNHRVQLFNENGVLLKLFDGRTVGLLSPRARLKLMDSPRGLAFKSDGSLLVTDFNNHRILTINKQFNAVRPFGQEGQAAGQFFRPQGIACDSAGRIAVADCKNYRIQIFDASGELQQVFGSQGNAAGQFDCPQGICFHPDQNLIVVDFNNNRIQVF